MHTWKSVTVLGKTADGGFRILGVDTNGKVYYGLLRFDNDGGASLVWSNKFKESFAR